LRTFSVWQPSLALAPVTTTPKGIARLSHPKCKLVPDFERSTGEGPVGSPFFRRLFRAVQEDLIPVDALELLVLLSQFFPGGAEDIELQPTFEPALNGLVGGSAGRQQLPGDAGNQDVEQSV
jgi:hypothetical protein